MQRQPAAANTATRTSIPDSSADAALAKSLAEIAAALRSLQGRAGSSRPLEDLSAAERIERWMAFDSAMMKTAVQGQDAAASHLARDVFSRKHLLWSQQDVIGAYGKPDSLRILDNGVDWNYTNVVPGEGNRNADRLERDKKFRSIRVCE